MVLLLSTAVRAAEVVGSPTLSAPDPVLRWAERDKRALRLSRVGLTTSLAAPGLIGIGLTSLRTVASQERPGEAFGLSMLSAGTLGLFVGPTLLLYGTSRSTIALRAQALDTPFAPIGVAIGLGAISLTSFAFLLQENSLFEVWSVVGLTSYTGAVAVSLGQLRANHIARRDAGWLGLVPVFTEGAPGVALSGIW